MNVINPIYTPVNRVWELREPGNVIVIKCFFGLCMGNKNGNKALNWEQITHCPRPFPSVFPPPQVISFFNSIVFPDSRCSHPKLDRGSSKTQNHDD